MKKPKICLKCGKKISHKGCLCKNSSPHLYNSNGIEEPTFLLTNEISEGNINIRLKEGFRLLQNN